MASKMAEHHGSLNRSADQLGQPTLVYAWPITGSITKSKVEEFYVLTALYGETRSLASSLPGSMPVSVEYALKRCDAIQSRVLSMLRTIGYDQHGRSVQSTKALRYVVARQTKRREQARLQACYQDAVLLLRKIVIGFIEHEQIGVTSHEHFPLNGAIVKPALANHSVQSVAPYMRQTMVIGKQSDRPPSKQGILAQTVFDTGSEIELISHSFVNRVGLLGLIMPAKTPRSIAGLGGSIMIAREEIKLTWIFSSRSPALDITCYLVDTAQEDFDILIGQDFLHKYKILVLQDPQLAAKSPTISVVRMGVVGNTEPATNVDAQDQRDADNVEELAENAFVLQREQKREMEKREEKAAKLREVDKQTLIVVEPQPRPVSAGSATLYGSVPPSEYQRAKEDTQGTTSGIFDYAGRNIALAPPGQAFIPAKNNHVIPPFGGAQGVQTDEISTASALQITGPDVTSLDHAPRSNEVRADATTMIQPIGSDAYNAKPQVAAIGAGMSVDDSKGLKVSTPVESNALSSRMDTVIPSTSPDTPEHAEQMVDGQVEPYLEQHLADATMNEAQSSVGTHHGQHPDFETKMAEIPPGKLAYDKERNTSGMELVPTSTTGIVPSASGLGLPGVSTLPSSIIEHNPAQAGTRESIPVESLRIESDDISSSPWSDATTLINTPRTRSTTFNGFSTTASGNNATRTLGKSSIKRETEPLETEKIEGLTKRSKTFGLKGLKMRFNAKVWKKIVNSSVLAPFRNNPRIAPEVDRQPVAADTFTSKDTKAFEEDAGSFRRSNRINSI